MLPTADLPPALDALAVPVEIQFSHETHDVSDGARMGMAGLVYRRPVGNRGLMAGIAVYGATTGDRGGFFGWGVHGAWRWPMGPWAAEAGLFAGGGGGSPGWVGGGLMLRPHLELSRAFGDVRLGLGVAQLRFPNGRVDSTQPYLSLSLTDRVFFGPPGGAGAPAVPATLAGRARASEIAPFIARYRWRQGSVRRDGTGPGEPLTLGGLTLRRTQAGADATGLQPYLLLSASGALTAAYAGYAELLAGGGVQMPLPMAPSVVPRLELAVGSGGGGARADSGGGWIARLQAGVAWRPAPAWTVGVMAGRMQSRRGLLDADEGRIEIGWRGWDLLPDAPPRPGGPAVLSWDGWSIGSGVHQFPRAARNGGGDPGFGSTALRAERALGPNWRLTALASIGITGDAGGYGTGQLGLAWLSTEQPSSRWRFGAELSIGAAGGGEVDVGNGLFGQGQLLARYRLSEAWALQAEAGWLRAAQGPFSTPLVGVTVLYSFSRLQGR